MILTYDDVSHLVTEQTELNEMFTVSRWDGPLVETALIVEYSELMAELEPLWKVRKPSQYRTSEAKVEFIDCVHFMLSLLIIRSEKDVDGLNIKLNTDSSKTEGDFLVNVNSSFKMFLASENSYPLSKLSFIQFVDHVTEFLKMDRETFFKYFETKKNINKARVSGGYLEGTYCGKEAEALQFSGIA